MIATEHHSASVVVFGGGAAGIAACLAAAKSGAETLLLEAAACTGGVVGRGLIHTIGGLYDAGGGLLNDGLSAELASRLCCASAAGRKRQMGRLWTLESSPHAYQAATQAWLAAEHVQVCTGVKAPRFLTTDGYVTSVTVETPRGTLVVDAPSAVIDCSGNANAVRAIEPRLVAGHAAGSLGAVVLRLDGIDGGAFDAFAGFAARQAIHRAVERLELPSSCRHIWLDRGVAADEVYVKVPIVLQARDHWPEPSPRDNIRLAGLVDGVVRVLASLPAFASARLVEIGEPSARGATRCRGEYELTAADVRSLRRFDDPACRCAWPIEHWDPDTGVRIEYLPDDGSYEVPIRALRVDGVRNLWCAGKCLSADDEAQASARIAGCCWATGEAAARAAVAAVDRAPSP